MSTNCICIRPVCPVKAFVSICNGTTRIHSNLFIWGMGTWVRVLSEALTIAFIHWLSVEPLERGLGAMNRRGYGRAVALMLGLLLWHLCNCNCRAELNDSTLRLHQYRHHILNGTSVWSLTPSVPLHTDKDSLEDVTEAGRHGAHLARSSVIYGLTEVANTSNVNAVCHAQLKHVQRGILNKQPWAMKGSYFA